MTTSPYNSALALLLAASSGGCFLFDLGTDDADGLGMIDVEAVLVEDSCGPGFGAPGPSTSYDVELRLSGSTLTWVAAGSSAQGSCDEDGRFCIEATRQWIVRDPDPWYEDPGCQMLSVERVCGAVDIIEEENDDGEATRRVASLEARHEVTTSCTGTSYCPEMIGLAQGQVLALPCRVAYELTGLPAD